MGPVIFFALLSLMGLCVPQASAQTPRIFTSGAVNAASYAPGPLTQGAIFSVFGTSLTDGSTAGAAVIPLPTRLAGARVLVNGVAAPLFFASPGQINAQFPVELTSGSSASVQVEVQLPAGTVSSSPVAVAVAPTAPGIFSQDQNGSGPGSIFRASDFSKICPPARFDCTARSAVPGETVSIFMTGLGAVNGAWVSGQPAQTALATITAPAVTIGGVQAQVLFSGLATRFVGLYQVNVTVPNNTPNGDSVPLNLTIGGKTSNTVTIAVGSFVSGPGGGPPGGSLTSIVIDPLNHSTLYAGANSGVFKSTNAGQSWTAANTGFEFLVRSLAIDPIHSATVYALTNSEGIYKSTDGGVSWKPASNDLVVSGASVLEVDSLAIDPVAPATLYAGTAGFGVFKSTDGGASWAASNGGSGLVNAHVSTMVVDPVNPAIVYAGANYGTNGPGVFKSTDGAKTWISSGLTEGVKALISDPANRATIYAGTAGNGVFKSSNGGQNWSALNNSPAYVAALAVDPLSATTVYAGIPGGVSKSTDGGATWKAAGGSFATTSVVSLAIDSTNPGIVFAAAGNGAFKSTNGGVSWISTNSGMTDVSISALAASPSAGAPLYAGTSGFGLFKSTNGGASWTLFSNAPKAGNMNAIVVDRSNPTVLYAGVGGASDGDGVYKSTDGGANWTRSVKGLERFGVRLLTMNPFNAAHLFVQTGGGLSKSTDGAATWNTVTILANFSFLNVQAVVFDPSKSGVVYAGTPNGVFKSTDGGTSWSAANNGLSVSNPLSSLPLYINALTIDPVNPATLYAGLNFAGAVYKSTDGGGSWTPANRGLPASLTLVLAIDPSNSARLYAATGVGVFRSTDGGANWSAGGNLPTSASSFVISGGTGPNSIYAGTWGAGVFKSTDGGLTWQPTAATQD